MLNQEEIVVAGLPLSFPKPTGNQLPTLAEWNQRYIEYVLAFTKGKKTAAARILGINRRTLYRRKKGSGADEAGDDMHEDMHDDSSETLHDQMANGISESSIAENQQQMMAEQESTSETAQASRDKGLHRMPVNHQVQ